MIISCRFVPYDKWLVTHIDPSKTICQIKHTLLTRCIGSFQQINPAPFRPSSPLTFAPYHTQRPISPIVFAKPPQLRRSRRTLRSPSFSGSDTDHHTGRSQDEQLDVVAEQDSPYSSDSQDSFTSSTLSQHRVPHRASHSSLPHVSVPDSPDSPPTAMPVISPEEARMLSQFSVIRFSTGQVLEDDFEAAWYSIRSHELLEIHHAGVVSHLPRTLAQEYAQPYFGAQVRVLTLTSGGLGNSYMDDEKLRSRTLPEDEKRSKAKDRDKLGDKERPKKIRQKDPDAPAKPERARTKKHKLEWEDKWLVIHTGVINICQNSSDTNPHRYPLSSLNALRGVEHLADADLIHPLPQRLICAGFRARHDASISTIQHGKENNKGKDSERRRLSTSAMPVNAGSAYVTNPSIDDTSADNVPFKKSVLPLTRSRDTDLFVTRSLGRVTRGDPKSKSRNSKPPLVLKSHMTGVIALSNTSSPTESSFALPTDSFNSVGGSVEDVRGYPNDDGESAGLDSYGFGDGEDDDGEWVILDMPDDDAYNSILRIFHRHFSPPMLSSFFPASTPYYTPHPSPTMPTFATPNRRLPADTSQSNASFRENRPSEKAEELNTGSTHHSPYAFGTVPYPEWRIAVVERAQRAGVGDISAALGLFLWGSYDGLLLPTDEELSVESAQHLEEGKPMANRSVSTIALNDDPGVSSISVPVDDLQTSEVVAEAGMQVNDKALGDTRSVLSTESNEERSEAEWEGWLGDLGRQQQRYITGRFGEDNNSSLPEIPWTPRVSRSSNTYEDYHGSSVDKQRRTQQARRALEPSGVVTRTSKAFERPRTTMSPSPSTISVSTDVSAEPPAFSGYPVAHGIDVYRAPLRSKMSIDEVLESAAPGPSDVLGGTIAGSPQAGLDIIVDERRNAAPEPVCSVPSPTPSTRKRSATSSEAFSNPSFASTDGDNSLAQFSKRGTTSSRKGKERENMSMKDAVHDKPMTSYTTTTEGMTSTRSLSSLSPARGQILTSESGSTRPRSRISILRHARSGSSLYDAAGGEQTSVGSGSGKKGSGFGLMRGVSARAGRFVKGLDAALDFVDGI